MTTTTQTTLLTQGNCGVVGLFLVKLVGVPILASALLVLPSAWVAGWLPTKTAMPYKLLTLLGDDFESAGTVFVADAHDPNEKTFIDRRSLWRVQLNPAAVARFTANRELRSVEMNSVPEYFWNQFPLWWPHHSPASGRFYSTARWEPDARGEEDLNFLMMYDEVEGAAYFWVKDNF